jgi:hypothetical protein
MTYVNRYTGIAFGICFLLACITPGVVIGSVSAADAYYDGYLGDTIDLHGVSYSGTQIFLFMTGPNLPADGVTLTDISQRADQGHFTTVDLDSSQQWSFKWNTAKIQSLIDPGTYTVYITTEPVDLSHLGSTNTYKTLSVYLRNPETPQGSSGPGTYTLNPEKHTSTMSVVPSMIIASPTVTPNQTTLIVTTGTSLVSSATTSVPVSPATQAPMLPVTPIIAFIAVACTFVYRKYLR